MMVNQSNKLQVTLPSDTEILMTRTFDAPRDLVWLAHTSCEHMKQWWGPARYVVSECDIDFRTGGKWRMVEKGDEAEFAFHGEFREIVRPEKIVWTFEFDGAPGEVSVDTLVLTEHDGKTTLTATSVFPSKESRDAMIESGMEEGAAETYDRLEAYAKTLA